MVRCCCTHQRDQAQYALCDWSVFKRHNYDNFSILHLNVSHLNGCFSFWCFKGEELFKIDSLFTPFGKFVLCVCSLGDLLTPAQVSKVTVKKQNKETFNLLVFLSITDVEGRMFLPAWHAMVYTRRWQNWQVDICWRGGKRGGRGNTRGNKGRK